MPEFSAFDAEVLHQWLPEPLQQRYTALLMQRVGMTRQWADCFIRLWLYLWIKHNRRRQVMLKPPLTDLAFPQGWVDRNYCSRQLQNQQWLLNPVLLICGVTQSRSPTC